MGAEATSTVGGLSLAQSLRLDPRTAVRDNSATMWNLGCLCPRPGHGQVRSENV